jgi:adenylate cyclase
VLLAPLPVLAWGGFAVFAFTAWQVWLNIAVPLVSGALAAIGVWIWRWLLSDTQRRRLAVYVPSRLADALAAADRPGFAERRQPVAILFVDLEGFTAQSEAEGPDATAALLRHLHGLFEDAAAAHEAAHEGYVDSFSGDGAMLVFGVPEPSPRDGANALACAQGLVARGTEAGLPLCTGVHMGDVRVARLGGRRYRQLTLAGDPVNLASRLMDLAKAHGGRLAASDPLVRAAAQVGGDEVLEGLHLYAGAAIRGRRQRLDVWIGLPPK